jgi:hypothetical protein
LFELSISTKLIVLACTDSLNTAVTLPPTATLVAPDDGLRVVTVGGVVSADEAVVNDHDVDVMALPDRSNAPLNVTVYVVADNRLELGVNVTLCVAGSYFTVAATVVEPFFSTRLIVLACTGSLNTAVTGLDTDTPVALALGLVVVTVGAVVSAAAVVNDHVNELITLPARSKAPESVTVYTVDAARFALGSNDTVCVAGS